MYMEILAVCEGGNGGKYLIDSASFNKTIAEFSGRIICETYDGKFLVAYDKEYVKKSFVKIGDRVIKLCPVLGRVILSPYIYMEHVNDRELLRHPTPQEIHETDLKNIKAMKNKTKGSDDYEYREYPETRPGNATNIVHNRNFVVDVAPPAAINGVIDNMLVQAADNVHPIEYRFENFMVENRFPPTPRHQDTERWCNALSNGFYMLNKINKLHLPP